MKLSTRRTLGEHVPASRSSALPTWCRGAALAILLLPVFAASGAAQVVISQVYGGGGNTGATYKNDFIELFNAGTDPVSLTGWSVQYGSSGGTSWTSKTNLTGTIAPGSFYLIQEAAGSGGTVALPTPDATGSLALSASAGKVALVRSTTAMAAGACPADWSIVADFVGFGGANCAETSPTPALSNTTAALRTPPSKDTGNNSADFTVGAPTPRNSSCTLKDGCPADPAGTGAAVPSTVTLGTSTLLKVTVKPGGLPVSTGLAVSADLTTVGGGAAQALFDDGTNGDAIAGDNVFSLRYTVPSSVATGAKTLAATITDAQGRSATASISLTVADATCNLGSTIAQIQGDGPTSLLAGQTVTTTGVVTGLKYNGLFIQMWGDGDGNPATSDGVFVYTGSTPWETVGTTLCVTGTVSEYSPSTDPTSPPMTEIVSPTVKALPEFHDLPDPVTITAAMTTAPDAETLLEALEGMRVRIESLTVVGPTEGSVSEANATASSNGFFYGVVAGVPRPMRTAGIDVHDTLLVCAAVTGCNIPIFDGNPQRIGINSYPWTDPTTKIDVAAGATLAGVVGEVEYTSRTYTIALEPGSPESKTDEVAVQPVPTPLAGEVTIASLNFERFYDDVANQAGDTKLTTAAFTTRVNKASLLIRDVLKLPDVLATVEVENLNALQKLADQVQADTGTVYAPYLLQGNDPSAINVGFLVKASRVTVLEVTQEGKTAEYTEPGGASALLNDRPPLVLRASVMRPGTVVAFPFTVIVNHLRSMSGLTEAGGDGPRVRAKRAAQAEFLANLVQQRQTAYPAEPIVVVGDFNAYQVNDGYVDMVGTIKGEPTPAEQVVVASPDLVNPKLINLGDALFDTGQEYSYVFDGNAQAIDHALVNAAGYRWVSRFAFGRVNADFPETDRNAADSPVRLSDHDPTVTYLGIGTPRIAGSVPSKTWNQSGQMVVQLRVSNTGGANAIAATLDSLAFRTLTGAGTVTVASCQLSGGGACGSPTALGTIAPSAWTDVILTLNVPPGVLRFSITETGSLRNPEGQLLRYSVGQAIIR